MTTLYLVRHGQAKSDQDDPHRPLTDHGRAAVTTVAVFLAQHHIPVGKILHSGKTRARQTAEILAGHLNPTGAPEAVENLTPGADPLIWAKRLRELDDASMLVGHLPYLDKLAAHLLCKNQEQELLAFEAGAVLCLSQYETERWAIRWMVSPALLK